MMYVPLLAQAAIVALVALFSGLAPAVDTARHPVFAAASYDKARLHCRLYFGCAPVSSVAIDSLHD